MGRYAIVVIGPAGSGKSTFCSALQEHASTIMRPKRTIHVANLDPAALSLPYVPSYDVRELKSVDEIQKSEELGPNGALIHLMEALLSEDNWFYENFGPRYESDFIVFDLPGQIELLSQIPIVPRLVQKLSSMSAYQVVVCFLLDAKTVVLDRQKYISGCLCALSAMVAIETPFLSFLTKVDRLRKSEKKRLGIYLHCAFNELEQYDPDDKVGFPTPLTEGENEEEESEESDTSEDNDREIFETDVKQNFQMDHTDFGQENPLSDTVDYVQRTKGLSKREIFNNRICSLIEDFDLVNFRPWSALSEKKIKQTFELIDYILQYGEDEDLPNPPDPDP